MDEKANKVRVANIDIPTANTWTPWALPKGCRWFTLQTRDGTKVKISRSPKGGTYFTLKADTSWDEKDFKVDSKLGYPLYFSCAKAGEVVEVILGVYEEEEE